jgi:hypothetical protein
MSSLLTWGRFKKNTENKLDKLKEIMGSECQICIRKTDVFCCPIILDLSISEN